VYLAAFVLPTARNANRRDGEAVHPRESIVGAVGTFSRSCQETACGGEGGGRGMVASAAASLVFGPIPVENGARLTLANVFD